MTDTNITTNDNAERPSKSSSYVMTVSNFSIVHINVVSFVIQSQCSTRVLSTHSTYFRQYSQIGWNSLILYQISGGRNESVGFQKSNKTLRGEMKKAMIMATMNDDE